MFSRLCHYPSADVLDSLQLLDQFIRQGEKEGVTEIWHLNIDVSCYKSIKQLFVLRNFTIQFSLANSETYEAVETNYTAIFVITPLFRKYMFLAGPCLPCYNWVI